MAHQLTTLTPPETRRPAFDADRLTREQAAAYIGVKPSTLENDVVTRRLQVPFYRVGKRPYYRRSDLAPA